MADPSPRNKLLSEVMLRLGAGIIDIELEFEHRSYALDVAFERYRQRSGNAIEESFVFLDIQPEVPVYTLPAEIQEVQSVYRHGIGGGGGSGASIDPFSLAYTNSIYMMQNPGGAMGNSGAGSLATYDFAVQFQNLAGRMFGRDVNFSFNASTKRLNLQRKFGGMETIALHVFNIKPEDVLLADPYARIWLRDFTVAQCKLIMGEARSKFASIAGPQGGVTLNGESLKTEAAAEIERLDKELSDFVDQHQAWPFIVG